MGNIDSLPIDEMRLKYTILRRAICYGNEKSKKIYNTKELKNLCLAIEGKGLEDLKKLHEEWIGY